ncbi:MAG: uracil-DNA glycosylase [Nitrososphaerota archaeon]|nr:uracil-DNA glycosylase [Nitrososphaerota archaeon]MCL5672300.1 uracil-DNA glycosylase [Nitrososphaerota archaeon]MCL5672302.1 uracil-DNA glycosylase [Nitrososphaerota archaeon]MDG6912341.1 uracil-DNA glycosylase [Nitrososphaerota archaeon]MDG6937400.1 uracil-DNA glycosylase [Nitrososphaerota archaeon]
MKPGRSAAELGREIVSCRACPRLVAYREGVEPRASYASQVYWRKPVPGFGDLGGKLLILGLAPALHGAERTGRIFTGDASSRFLVTALHSAGFANQPMSESRDDGLVYRGCYITAAVKCVPPGDKPTREEFDNCSRFLDAEISLMPSLEGVLALGSLAFKAYVSHLARAGTDVRGMVFEHGASYRVDGGPVLYAGYHPSPRNTNTGKLTMPMLVGLLKKIRRDLRI